MWHTHRIWSRALLPLKRGKAFFGGRGMTGEKPKQEQQPLFIPSLLGEEVTLRLKQGRPITGILKGHNAYVLLIESRNRLFIVLKGSIAVIEVHDPEKYWKTFRSFYGESQEGVQE
jgi:small nuclear ribonucleoprotein (snRNP)-like protein